MVKILKRLKTLTTIFFTLTLALALIKSTEAQTLNEMETFFSENYPGISIKVNATKEALPGENITINLLAKCTALDVEVNHLFLSVYGFVYGREKILLKNFTFVTEKTPLIFNHTSQYNDTVLTPGDVWYATYAELYLEYTLVGKPFEDTPSFSMTIVRNVYLEELENLFRGLNESYMQLNQTFWECFQMNLTAENLAFLNRTYWELQQNYTALQGGLNELDNTRRVVTILAITTVFFVATTLYLVMRKPKEHW